MNPQAEGASDKLFEKLQKAGREKVYESGEEIFAEGDRAEFLPIVLSGRVKVVRYLDIGKEVIINIFQPGEVFAIPPVLDSKSYPATAIAMEKSTLLLIGRSDFLTFLEESDEFSSMTMSRMSELLRETTRSMTNLATASTEHRVGNVLLRLAEKENNHTPLKISLRRQDIADMAGLTTETTIRAVRKLAGKELVKIVHGKIILEDIDVLKNYLSS